MGRPMHKPASLFTTDDIARRTHCDARTVRRWHDDGKLPPAIVIGGLVRWNADDIEAWLREQTEVTP